MISRDEDASLTQLSSGWLHLRTGGDKLQEAFYIFTEMADKNTKTPLLAVGLASVLIAQGEPLVTCVISGLFVTVWFVYKHQFCLVPYWIICFLFCFYFSCSIHTWSCVSSCSWQWNCIITSNGNCKIS